MRILVVAAVTMITVQVAHAQQKAPAPVVRDHTSPGPRMPPRPPPPPAPVVAKLALTSFTPASGAPGTRVEIVGAGFLSTDQVKLGATVLAPAELAATRIVVVIPPGAASEFFTVARADGAAKVRSKNAFKVIIPPPAIESFAPTSGPPGAKVKIYGSSFGPRDRAVYGKWPDMKIAGRSDTFLEVTIPANATKSDTLTVTGPHGSATSTQTFTLIMPPVVGRVTPLYGLPGAKVEIAGDHFLKTDEVSFSGHTVKIVAFDEKKLTVEVPADGKIDAFTILRGGAAVATSREKFEVVVAPTIAKVDPPGGPAGTTVTITGAGFSADAKVHFGTQALRVAARATDGTSLTIQIPGGAVSSPITIETRGGKVTTPDPFQVHVYSTITSVAPLAGPPGTRLTIKGTNFKEDTFYLNTVPLAIVERGGGSYLVQVPLNGQTGPISWESYGRRQTSKFSFTITVPPLVTAIAPASGAVGAEVTITGENFTAQSKVLFGTTPCQIVKKTLPTQLVAVIPAGAAGTDFLWVEDAGKRFKAPAAFQVMEPPVLVSIEPMLGPVGSQVTITGANLTDTSTVKMGARDAKIVSKRLPSTLVVEVPAGLGQGKVWIEVTDGKKRLRSPAQFVVTVVPVIASVAPLTGPAGTKVTIKGTNFGPGAMVYWGGKPCTIVSRGGRTQIVVALPADGTGVDTFTVEDNGAKALSADVFTMVAAPSPPPIVRDHTGKP